MSVSLLGSPGLAGATELEGVRAEVRSRRQAGVWSPETFAREQIRGLVQQVFFSNAVPPVRQVVFSAVESETDVRTVCRQVGEALALETPGSVAVVGAYPQLLQNAETHCEPVAETGDGSTPLRTIATRVRANLWLVPTQGKNGGSPTAAALHSYLSEVRSEFEYSIVAGAPAGEANEAAAMAQFADGIILVLSARNTRRVAARRVKETLETTRARILGTVLSDRMFPVPEAIYRRL